MSSRLLFWAFVVLMFALVFAIAFGILDLIIWGVMRWFASGRTIRNVCISLDAALLASLVIAVVVGHYHTRYVVDVNRVEVSSPRLPAAFDGLRVAHISDFHLDSFDAGQDDAFMQRLADSIFAAEPDIICFTGDLVTISSVEARPWRSMLARLASHPNIPVFTIMGNHDYADYVAGRDEVWREADRDNLRRTQTDAGWLMLDNASATMSRGGEKIAIVGVGNIGEPPFTTYGNLPRAMQGIDADSTFTILLSHNPMHWRSEVLPDTPIDLMLAGHTHAMQMRVFGWSPAAFRYKEWGGLYREGQQYLYVNTGVGCTGPRVRIGVPPEVTIIILRHE